MWNWMASPNDICECGRRLISSEGPRDTVDHDVRCACGRLAAYAQSPSGWALQALLMPERSVPVGGFSHALREEPDAERFWFLHPIGTARLPVHIVFSPSLKIAEVKAADLKVLHLEDVWSVAEARRQWVERRQELSAESSPSERFSRSDRPRNHTLSVSGSEPNNAEAG